GLYKDRPAALASIRALHDEYAKEFRSVLSQETYQRSALHGRAVAKAVQQWSKTDGYKQYNACAYTPPVGKGLWIPTPPNYAPALQPCWGMLRTSATPDGSYSDPGPPPEYSEVPGTPFYIEAEEVLNTVANLTQEQLDIALFWSDDPGTTGTPPGHSISICRQIIEQEGIMLDGAAEAYARVGLAVHDAFINCWWSKYEHNLLRPVTYIRNLWDPDWLPPLGTPPFPEYTSGHSVQSGAAFQVMTDMWGDIPFTDHTHDARGLAPRSFNTFFEAAEEAAISRLYGGIHYRAAIDLGVTQGMLVGSAVSALDWHSVASVVATTR
ncbi:MAG: vanadium-dependent haloperoxidase, partial [Ignavibacteria bacterium]|nr:vanadium-dependent haloperoxidase [Ignavibacteria bacterium]